MGYKFNPTTGLLDIVGSGGTDSFKGILPVAPAIAIEGDSYVNSSDDGYYLYYSSQWQLLHVLYSAPPTPIITGNPFGLWLPFWRTYQV
jgi:hypothetical protein